MNMLQWEQVDLEASSIQLAPEDTKTDEPRLIVLTSRAKEALRTLPSRFKKTGQPTLLKEQSRHPPDLEERLSPKATRSECGSETSPCLKYRAPSLWACVPGYRRSGGRGYRFRPFPSRRAFALRARGEGLDSNGTPDCARSVQDWRLPRVGV